MSPPAYIESIKCYPGDEVRFQDKLTFLNPFHSILFLVTSRLVEIALGPESPFLPLIQVASYSQDGE